MFFLKNITKHKKPKAPKLKNGNCFLHAPAQLLSAPIPAWDAFYLAVFWMLNTIGCAASGLCG